MSRAYRQWYNNLTPRNQFLVTFLLNWVFWLVGWVLADELLLHEDSSWVRYLFGATWMAFFTTVPFNWKKVKAIFKSEQTLNEHDA